MSQENNRSSRARGDRFERRAEEFLLKQGYEILARNWQAGHKEIDLVARKEMTLAFVEVKGSRGDKFGHPAYRVDRKKRENLALAAERFITEMNLRGYEFRFDVITIYEGILEHFPGAFQVESEESGAGANNDVDESF